ncbi:hypothetical protein AN189_11395 [Loktanella sp. 3ANDIMAR09]|nr:hypothetical protein AN189_11395 [Loktanella sp. 3ANDIMAR09]
MIIILKKFGTDDVRPLPESVETMTASSRIETQGALDLAASDLFCGIAEDDLQGIADRMTVMTVPKGRLIMQHGDLATDVFFVLSGTVIGQLVAQSGRQILFTEFDAGAHFGEMAALDGAARSITISASSDCRIARLTEADFTELMMTFPRIAINLARELGKRLRSMNDRLFGLVMHDVETRVAIRIMQLAQDQEQLVQDGTITDVPTHEALASFVGSNREAVSRSVARLAKSGIIATDRGRIDIRDLDRLMDAADP